MKLYRQSPILTNGLLFLVRKRGTNKEGKKRSAWKIYKRIISATTTCKINPRRFRERSPGLEHCDSILTIAAAGPRVKQNGPGELVGFDISSIVVTRFPNMQRKWLAVIDVVTLGGNGDFISIMLIARGTGTLFSERAIIDCRDGPGWSSRRRLSDASNYHTRTRIFTSTSGECDDPRTTSHDTRSSHFISPLKHLESYRDLKLISSARLEVAPVPSSTHGSDTSLGKMCPRTEKKKLWFRYRFDYIFSLKFSGRLG